MYLPLVDMTPAEPDTMLTAMVEVQRLTRLTGQEYTIFTNDQQLYKVVVGITWVYHDLFKQFIPRLGGMHTLMNFGGAVGMLMTNTGLDTILQSAFGGVPKLMAGKNFPQNVRALRMVAEELLRSILPDMESSGDMMSTLTVIAERSRTTKLWVDSLLKLVFLMMMFIRAEREADWPLHMWVVRHMMPYFFASGNSNYARYCLYYLRSMENLPEPVLKEFMNGNHVMRHQPGIWNSIWSDMFIESTFMRYGHGPRGIVGITLNTKMLKRWEFSLLICSRLAQDVKAMTDGDKQITVTEHKEESPSRIQSDEVDRAKIREYLVTCIDPLSPETHPVREADVHQVAQPPDTQPEPIQPAVLLNIVTGQLSPGTVNVDRSVAIGTAQMEEYEAQWPGSFNKSIPKKVVSMAVARKHITVGQVDLYETNLIYSRLLGLQQARELDLKDVLMYECSPVPTSLFEDSGNLRVSKTKSVMKNKLQVELSGRRCPPPDVVIIDGCAVLWVVQWPTKGTVQDYIMNFMQYLTYQMKRCDTLLVFDRYHDDSIKRATSNTRAGSEASRKHKLTLSTPLPPQKVTLTVTDNKVQLITLICSFIVENANKLPDGSHLVVTGFEPEPLDICNGDVIARNDLATRQEEADTIMIHQMVYLASQGRDTIYVICDDTDVFVLLVHFYATQKLNCNVLMVGTSPTRSTADIRATYLKHTDIAMQLLPCHAMSGCDTVSALSGIGKGKALKALYAGHTLDKLGEDASDMTDVIAEATSFTAACYGSKETEMSEIRYDIWSSKMANAKLTSAPDLKSLPPTVDAYEVHVRRAHFQASIWRNALQSDPPELDPTKYGWYRDATTKMLQPVMLPEDVSPAPISVLKLIKCGCSSGRPCSTARCSCASAKLSCSMFCTCRGREDCHNEQTKAVLAYDGDDSGDDD